MILCPLNEDVASLQRKQDYKFGLTTRKLYIEMYWYIGIVPRWHL